MLSSSVSHQASNLLNSLPGACNLSLQSGVVGVAWVEGSHDKVGLG